MKLWNKEVSLVRTLDAAKILRNELDRYEKIINEEIKFKQRVMISLDEDKKSHDHDKEEINDLQSLFPQQLRCQLGRWLKRANKKRD